jgi:hypothetical protein
MTVYNGSGNCVITVAVEIVLMVSHDSMKSGGGQLPFSHYAKFNF